MSSKINSKSVALKILQVVKDNLRSPNPKSDNKLVDELKKIIDIEVEKSENK